MRRLFSLGKSLNRVIQKIYISYLNLLPNVSVHPDVFFSSSARIILNPDGYSFKNQKVTVSKGCRICDHAMIVPYGGEIFIDENVFVGPFTILYGHGGLRIGKNTLIAAHTTIIPFSHKFNDLELPIYKQGLSRKGISIGEDVWIGAGVRILDGVTIGKGCVIGAGSVVTKSIEDYMVVAGVPVKILGVREK